MEEKKVAYLELVAAELNKDHKQCKRSTKKLVKESKENILALEVEQMQNYKQNKI